MKRIALAAALLAGLPALAHHSAAMFDQTKRITIDGTVKEWQWTNPHSWLQVNTIEPDGKTVEQGFEFGSPNTMFRNGFRAGSFKVGDKVRVIAAPRRDGTLGGLAIQVRTAAGQWLQWGPGADAAAQKAAGVGVQ